MDIDFLKRNFDFSDRMTSIVGGELIGILGVIVSLPNFFGGYFAIWICKRIGKEGASMLSTFALCVMKFFSFFYSLTTAGRS